MSWKVPERFRDEQAAVEAQIREAFRGVTREGGVSWSEAKVVDLYGYDHERVAARAKDTERRWEDLVDDRAWEHEVGVGGFNFLDSIGYRYYIAPAMIRCIRRGGGEFISYALRIDNDFKRDLACLINPKQAHAIARFVRLMVAIHADAGDDIYGPAWTDAYTSHWRAFDKGNTVR